MMVAPAGAESQGARLRARHPWQVRLAAAVAARGTGSAVQGRLEGSTWRWASRATSAATYLAVAVAAPALPRREWTVRRVAVRASAEGARCQRPVWGGGGRGYASTGGHCRQLSRHSHRGPLTPSQSLSSPILGADSRVSFGGRRVGPWREAEAGARVPFSFPDSWRTSNGWQAPLSATLRAIAAEYLCRRTGPPWI